MNKIEKPKTFSTSVDLAIAKKLMEDLKKQGFSFAKPLYTVFSAKKKGLTCTLYSSGKLVVQGKDTAEFVEFYLEPEVLGSFEYSYASQTVDMTARIGIDEAGKGDFFGPLCIAGVFANKQNIPNLSEIGVKDSKSMTDKTVIRLANLIKKAYPYHIVRISPRKYNELYTKFQNLNTLLAWGHATAIESLSLKVGCKDVIIDQFAAESVVKNALAKKGLTLNLTQRHRGESDVVVAAASILARAAFLEGLELLSQEYAMKLPKGASRQTIQVGKCFLLKHDKHALSHVGKMHFKTLDAILAENSK